MVSTVTVAWWKIGAQAGFGSSLGGTWGSFALWIKVGTHMSLQSHYAVIQEKHHKLEALINEETHRPSPDLAMLQTMKKQKLLLKEELERIRGLELQRLDAA
jgi:hypothetical protein